MKIAVISKSSRNGGGASRVAEELALWLNQSGHDTDHFLANTHTVNFDFQQSLYGKGLKSKLCNKIHRTTYKYGYREFIPAEYFFNLASKLNNYDILHFHDLYTSIAPLSMALSSRHKPTVFTVHDCSIFTGGCLYPMDCSNYLTGCHQCPQLKMENPAVPDRTRSIQKMKQWISEKCPIHYVFPSQWMKTEAEKVLKFRVPPMVINNGIDIYQMSPANKTHAKASLKLPSDRLAIAISADNLANPRKGVTYAVSALQSIRDLNPLVVTIGEIDQTLRQELQGLDVLEMGYVGKFEDLIKLYAAVDILLFCSLADNFPMTALESMANGVTIVGFATGGMPEIIQNHQAGFLVTPMDQDALNHALRRSIAENLFQKCGQVAKEIVKNQFSRDNFIKQHIDLYQQIAG